MIALLSGKIYEEVDKFGQVGQHRQQAKVQMSLHILSVLAEFTAHTHKVKI